MSSIKKYSLGLIVPLLILGMQGCFNRSPVHDEFTFTGSTMGTSYHVTLLGEDINLKTRSSVAMQVDSVLKAYNQVLSTYEQHSEISLFNRNQSVDPINVSPRLMKVVRTGLMLCDLSGGAFDITVMPIVNFFGFGFEPGEDRFPTVDELDAWLDLTGCGKLDASTGELIKSDPRVSIDLSAIAKGDASDIVADFLVSEGYQNLFVEIGGEIVTKGVNKFDRTWQIGIDRPNWGAAPGADLQHIIKISDMAVATSGDYRNYREVDGMRVSHTIDPRNGAPISHNLAAVTVISESCMIADGLATSVMVMGHEAGLEWLENYSGAEGLLIVRNSDGSFTESMTSGFEQYISD